MTTNLIPSGGSGGLEPREGLTPAETTGYDLGPAEPAAEGIQWGRYVAALQRYKWLMLLVVLLGTGIGVGITQFVDPEYQARSTIYINDTPTKTGPIQTDQLVTGQGWVELLRTFQVFDSVVLKEQLFIEPRSPSDSAVFRNFRLDRRYFTGKYELKVNADGSRFTLVSSDGLEIDRGAVGDSVGRRIGWLWQPPRKVLGRDRTIKFKVVTTRDAAIEMQENFTNQMAPQGSFLRLSYNDTDPYRAARVLNAIDTQFVSLAAELKRKQLGELSMILKDQLDTMTAQLREAESRLETFRIQVITEPSEELALAPGVGATQNPVMQNYFNQRLALEALKRDREAIENVLGRLASGEMTVDAFQTITAVRGAPNLLSALTELQQRESELRALRYRYTDEHKPVQDVLAQIRDLRGQTIPSLASALVTQLRAQESQLGREIEGASRELRAIPSRTIEEARLTREVMQKEALARELSSRYEQNRLAEASAVPDISILDDAQVPEKPASNTAPRIILMAFVASLGVAVALAVLLDQLDKRFRYPEQVTNELGLSILGAIPGIRRANGRQLKSEEAAQVVEAFRTVRLNLTHSYGSAGPVMLTVSSPGSGDGKSLVSSNLALSFAEAGYRTLLVDGDIRRGELHRMFAVDRRPGLLDYLVGDAELDHVIRTSSHDGLSIIPCGARRQEGPELLGSSAMRHLMAEMKARFNVIIVDSPPLGAGIDPFVLGTATGHMLMVFRSGETDREMAEAKLKLLDRLPVRVLGAVLNDIQAEGVYRYYSYLYGYTADEDGARQLAGQVAGANGDVSSET